MVIKAEVVSIYDLVKAIKRNIESMNGGLITIYNNNSKLIRVLSTKIEKVTQFIQEAIAMITVIKQICNQMNVIVRFEYTKGYPRKIKEFS